MARDTSEERRQRIIQSAFKVFSEKGFRGATNKLIAREAGITPGLIYWYFKNKEDLFNAVFEAKAPVISLRKLRQAGRETPPELFFTQLASLLLEFWLSPEFAGLFRLVIGEVSSFPVVGRLISRKLTSSVHDVVVEYIQDQVEAGVLRPVDPLVATQAFLGSLISFVLLGKILQSDRIAAIPADTVVETVVGIFLAGLRSQSSRDPHA